MNVMNCDIVELKYLFSISRSKEKLFKIVYVLKIYYFFCFVLSC